jgi:hypothetical protein
MRITLPARLLEDQTPPATKVADQTEKHTEKE